MKSVTLKIDGMRCEGCARIIHRLVKAEPGVREASVSFKNGEARVFYDGQLTSDDHLVTKIEAAGFRVPERTH